VPNLPAAVQNVPVDVAGVSVEVLHVTVGVADPPDDMARGAHEKLPVEARACRVGAAAVCDLGYWVRLELSLAPLRACTCQLKGSVHR
jgi:hypothetical protein